MKIDTGLGQDLRLLTAALDEPGADIAAGLRKLAADAKAAVPSYVGLSVIVSVGRNEPRFIVTGLADGAVAGGIATSLGLMLQGVGGAPLPAVTIILYAGSPGAFVDLAADLAWLTDCPSSDFVLDQNLTIPTDSGERAPVTASSMVNQALGVLIGRGLSPMQADRHLDTRAAHAGTDRYGAATLIIATLHDRQVGPHNGDADGRE